MDKKSETICTILLNLKAKYSRPIIILIDNDPYLFLDVEKFGGTKVVIPKGKHLIQIIDKSINANSNTITNSLEFNFTSDISSIIIKPNDTVFQITVGEH